MRLLKLGSGLAWLTASLAGCGGGGGGDPAPPPTNPPLTITTPLVEGVVIEGEVTSLAFSVTLDEQVSIPGTFAFQVRHPGVFTKTTVFQSAPRAVFVNLHTPADLPAGEYTGSIDVFICRDVACNQRYSDVPAQASYRLNVVHVAAVSPPSLTGLAEAGEDFDLTVAVNVHPAFGDGPSFGIVDSLSLFDFKPHLEESPANRTYNLLLGSLADVAPGTYNGTLTLFICGASACSDNNNVGIPISIPYVLTVVPPIGLPETPTLTGLPEWETFQGNAAHTGYVPVTLDPADFASRWSWTSPFPNGSLGPVATGKGKVVVATTHFAQEAYLAALDEANGTIVWQYQFPPVRILNPPGVTADRIFIATSGLADTAMWSFDLDDGHLVFRTPFAGQHQRYLAPSVADSVVYTNGGTDGGLYAFRATNGKLRWFAPLPASDLWSPAIGNGFVYAHGDSELVALTPATGARAFTVPNNGFNILGRSLNTAPVIDTPDTVIAVDVVHDDPNPNRLIRYDVRTERELWRIDGEFANTPAVAAGKIYVLNRIGNRLGVYDSNGSGLWDWTPPSPNDLIATNNLILTDNLVLLSTDTTTYAVDITTHQDVWSVPLAGRLALSSNGVLYIVGGIRIDAFDLL